MFLTGHWWGCRRSCNWSRQPEFEGVYSLVCEFFFVLCIRHLIALNKVSVHGHKWYPQEKFKAKITASRDGTEARLSFVRSLCLFYIISKYVNCWVKYGIFWNTKRGPVTSGMKFTEQFTISIVKHGDGTEGRTFSCSGVSGLRRRVECVIAAKRDKLSINTIDCTRGSSYKHLDLCWFWSAGQQNSWETVVY